MSQSADLLALLSDGRPHEMRAIHRAIGFCRLNSRVSELRGRGYRIECDKTGGQYVYTLISRPLEGGAGTSLGVPACHAPASPSSERGSGVLPDNDRVDTNVQSPAPLDSSKYTPHSEPDAGIATSGHSVSRGGQEASATDLRFADVPSVLPDGQLTLRWAA